MPTTFTHDVFGKDVFKKLPKELKETIRQGKELYRIGLHGPDIFFYYRPIQKNAVNETGHRMHREAASVFFERAIQKFHDHPSPQLASYLLGFACHYMLDSTCHRYIGEFERETGASHAEIETEMDRYFMVREGKELFSYLPTCALKPTKENCSVIAGLFPQVGLKKIQKAIAWQKMYDKLLTCRSDWKEKMILGGMKALRCYDSMEGQVMRKKESAVCKASAEKLAVLYQKALEDAPAALENLYQCLYGQGQLSPRFDRNFE